MTTLKTFGSCAMLGALVSMMSLRTAPAFAQEGDALIVEEVVVTAQRREQLLQEVPISIEAISGAEINQQGFRNLNDLANFSPSVLIEPRLQEQDIAIRGFGTTGNSLTLEQAAPTFLDGIHFGRSSQIKLAFLDVERVEILKGPQPVFFGQNATAGAFNLQSRMPTPEWEVECPLDVVRVISKSWWASCRLPPLMATHPQPTFPKFFISCTMPV